MHFSGVYERKHILLGTHTGKPLLAAKSCSAHVLRPFQSPDHSRAREAEQQPQEDCRVSQQGKTRSLSATNFVALLDVGRDQARYLTESGKRTAEEGTRVPKSTINGSADS